MIPHTKIVGAELDTVFAEVLSGLSDLEAVCCYFGIDGIELLSWAVNGVPRERRIEVAQWLDE